MRSTTRAVRQKYNYNRKSNMETPKSQTIADLIAPSALSIASNYLQIGEKYARTMFVASYPRYLHTNWFSPVINLDRVFDISIFVIPKNTATVLKQLRD